MGVVGSSRTRGASPAGASRHGLRTALSALRASSGVGALAVSRRWMEPFVDEWSGRSCSNDSVVAGKSRVQVSQATIQSMKGSTEGSSSVAVDMYLGRWKASRTAAPEVMVNTRTSSTTERRRRHGIGIQGVTGRKRDDRAGAHSASRDPTKARVPPMERREDGGISGDAGCSSAAEMAPTIIVPRIRAP